MKKLRSWDSELLSHAYIASLQIQLQINQVLEQLTKEDITELPSSMVPTKLLYEIVASNDLMYNMLLDSDLIKSGNSKQDSSKIH